MLTTLASVRAYLGIAETETRNDTTLTVLIARAHAALEGYTNRQLGDKGASTRIVRVDARRYANLGTRDLRGAPTSVTLHPGEPEETILTSADYDLEPDDDPTGLATYKTIRLSPTVTIWSARAMLFGSARLAINGNWGATVVPDDLEQACIAAVASWYRRDIAAATVDGDLPPDVPLTDRLPADARMLARRFKHVTADA